ncbi:hypothetical protein ACTG23_18405 [Aeromonas enteropelogenes]|uniref:hypothetical protein n=1 Tax=Aeromonas enteropelogenes TaxID=29489 RepID=UPI003F7A8232
MKWILALLFFIPLFSFAIESAPAKQTSQIDKLGPGSCSHNWSNGFKPSASQDACLASAISYVQVNSWSVASQVMISSNTNKITVNYYLKTQPNYKSEMYVYFEAVPKTVYICPPDDKPDFTVGPLDLNGSQVCQKKPKICMMGAILRVTSDGRETCVPNCQSAAGLVNSSQYFFQPGPDVGSTAGQVACYGQCAIQTTGGGLQTSSGAWTGSYTFTGANCPVKRPEPTIESESNTGSNGDSTPVDESVTSPGTENALDQLEGAASGATSSTVKPESTGPNGETTLKDVAKAVTDSANAQIKANSEQNVATGKLMSNLSKDLQNAIKSSGGGGGGGGASASLQAQGNAKLDGIKDKLGEISDKLDKEDEGDKPFVPGAGSGPFWESVLPESSFTEIKDKKAESIQQMKDLASEFQASLNFTELSASGEPDEWSLNMNGTALPFGMGAFQMMLDMGIASIILLICALYAIYIITNRK